MEQNPQCATKTLATRDFNGAEHILPSGTTHNGKACSKNAWMNMSTPASEPPSTEPAQPTDPIEPAVDIAQPTPPPPPSESPQTFKCPKCGATFADEGSAAAHIQTCKVPEDTVSEDEGQQKPTPQPPAGATPPSIGYAKHHTAHRSRTIGAWDLPYSTTMYPSFMMSRWSIWSATTVPSSAKPRILTN